MDISDYSTHVNNLLWKSNLKNQAVNPSLKYMENP